ncbi:hypothetical protein AMTRI_Chr04g251360 [Amborella trichopoda]
MASSLDMSLDDIIKNNRRSSNVVRGRVPGRGRGRGQTRGGGVRGRGRGPLRLNPRPSSYSIAKSFSRTKDMIWQHDMFEDSMIAAGLTGIESGTKLYISNLDYGVSNEDIRELFSEIGPIKRCAVHYDRSGRSSLSGLGVRVAPESKSKTAGSSMARRSIDKGTRYLHHEGSAEVVFTKRSNALAAVKRYNNVQLDGKPMKIELIGTNLGMPVSARVNVTGGAGRGRRTVVMTPEFGPMPGVVSGGHGTRWGRGRGGFRRGGRGGRGRGVGGRGRGRGRGRNQAPPPKSADELDKELESYHANAN